jgi:hypothetical protein
MIAYVESAMLRDEAMEAFFSMGFIQLPNTSTLVLECLHLTVD